MAHALPHPAPASVPARRPGRRHGPAGRSTLRALPDVDHPAIIPPAEVARLTRRADLLIAREQDRILAHPLRGLPVEV